MTGEKIPACHLSNKQRSNPEQSLTKASKSASNRHQAPIPKGRSYYALAKYAEYISKNLEKAEVFYKKAILADDRKESAIKDLAALLHQQGKTVEACQILEKFSKSFKSNPEKLQNLYSSLKRHLNTNPTSHKKKVKISGFLSRPTQCQVFSLFSNHSRIKKMEISETDHSVYLEFNSKSSCRKTFEGFSGWDLYKCCWVSGQYEFLTEFCKGKKGFCLKGLDGDFDFKLFTRDSSCLAFCAPIDGECPDLNSEDLNINEKNLLGEDFANVLDNTQQLV